MYILTDVTTAEWDNYVGFKQRHGAFDTVQWKWIMLTHSCSLTHSQANASINTRLATNVISV